MEVQLMRCLSLLSLYVSHSLPLFLQGEPINMLPTWHWITKACCWLRSENQPCATFLCRCLCQFLTHVCTRSRALRSDWLTWIKRPTPGGTLLSGQKERPLQLHYISPRADAFLLTFFFPFPFSFSAQTAQPLRLICFSALLLRWPAGLAALIAHRRQGDVELKLNFFHKSPSFIILRTFAGSTVFRVIAADGLMTTVCLLLYSG